MSKRLAALTGLLLVGCLAAWAQTPGTPGGRPPIQQASSTAPANYPATRVAVLNINTVLKNYHKAQALNSQIKGEVQNYAAKMNSIREEIAKVQAEIAKPTTTQQSREGMEKQVLSLNRQLQDMDNDARKVISEKQKDIAIQIFKEVEQVVTAVATTYNFDLVLSYPDATTTQEMYIQENVVRKLAAQAAIPLWHKKHIDVTDAVVQTLNASFPAPAATAPAAPTNPPAAQPPK